MKAGRPNPISSVWEIANSAALNFPGWHTMGRWETAVYKQKDVTYLGVRLGDTIDFNSLPTEAQTLEMAAE